MNTSFLKNALMAPSISEPEFVILIVSSRSLTIETPAYDEREKTNESVKKIFFIRVLNPN